MLSIAVCDDKAIYGMEEETREAREKAELKREEAIQKRKEEREKSEERIAKGEDTNVDIVEISEEGRVLLQDKADSVSGSLGSGEIKADVVKESFQDVIGIK